jgi:hypothetical protein
MALSRVVGFNWEKVLARLPSAESKRAALLLRASANEVVATAAKYGDKPSAIDFSAYKKKLKFTGATVDKLEALYNSRQSPDYFAQVPEFEVQKREVTQQVLERIVEARKQDIAELQTQLVELEGFKITDETTIGELYDRFPEIATEIEAEIKNHEWAGVKN